MGTNLAGVDIIIIIGFLVVVSVVGYMMSKVASQGLDDYFLGGNKIPWWVLGASTSTSNFDMAGTMIIVAVVFALGYKGFLVEIRGGVGMSLAFLVVFLAKWLRRSRVMTSAEWMRLRFGTDKQGRAAHLFSAFANILLSLGMIVYFAKGAGKFLTHFIPIPEVANTSIMVAIGLFYTLAAGLYGVVFTDIIQMILLVFTAIYITVNAFSMTSDINFANGFLDLNLEAPLELGASLLAKDAGTWEPIFSMFGICVMVWILRSTLEGVGGVGGYTDQRFFAAKNEREASVLTMEAIVLSVFRWLMVAGLVVMGLHIVQTGGAGADLITSDAENVLPVVLGQALPAGIKGLVVAGLIAAAMSTFDSTLNAGASYIVKDVYQAYYNPKADTRKLMSVSRWATVGLCLAGIGFAAIVPNINKIWGLITTGLGPGLFVPLALRWYWPRMTGYGFAAGTGVGIVAGLTFDAALGWPLYTAFPSVLISAFATTVIVSLLTAPTPDRVLMRFWQQINPWGLWGKYAERARAEGLVDKAGLLSRIIEKLNDAIALCFAVPFQISMLIASMAFVFHDWKKFTFFTIIAAISAVGMYFFWYKNLKTTEQCELEDELYGDPEPAPASADEEE